MIVVPGSVIFDIAELQAALDRVVRGLCLVRVRTSADDRVAAASGWLITADLLVVPSFVVAQGTGAAAAQETVHFECIGGGEPEPISARPVFTDPGSEPGPALLRMDRRLEDRFLPVDIEHRQAGEQVAVPQHPEGRARPHLSIGRLLEVGDRILRHDAATRGGSSGAPIINSAWKVIGLHIGRNVGDDPANPAHNEALSISAVLDAVKATPFWAEIAAAQRLVDVAAVRQELQAAAVAETARPSATDDLLPAAVRWSFDPGEFEPAIRDRLRAVVVNPGSTTWVLRPAYRERLLRTATPDTLRRARGDAAADGPGQAAIDRILAGPPFPLDEPAEPDLPYWLQAVRWFAGVVDGLPTAAAINRQLHRLRFRSRLAEISREFHGRDDELTELRTWYDGPDGPIMITGVGGVGKSALIARFVLTLPTPPVVLWLDFDRVDLDPDEPSSVVRQAFEQLAVQVDDVLAPVVDERTWSARMVELATVLGAATAGGPKPLVVMDGFEIAQHASSPTRLWGLLETVLEHAPETRIVVSGRAPVRDLVLAGRPALPLVLNGLAVQDATAWLVEKGITEPGVLDRVLEITRRVPLALRLALRLVDEGVSIADLPDQLPDRLVDGYLYRRILDRVVDPNLKPLVQAALVLRRIGEDMLEPVLGDRIPAGWSATDALAALALEYGLVGDAVEAAAVAGGRPALTLRSEVRQSTLRLLEQDDRARVQEIDRRAADWYLARPVDDLDDVDRAELIYHLLRSGRLAEAGSAWRDSCARLLLDADGDLPPDAEAERAWLRGRTRLADSEQPSLLVWEQEAASRIRDLLSRGHLLSVGDVLAERADRSPASPLVLFDAWTAWRAGRPADALDILRAAGPAGGSVGRDRTVLWAALARGTGALDEADRLLAEVSDPARWDATTDVGPVAGAALGGAIGAALGTIIGPVGAAVGAGTGAAIGRWMGRTMDRATAPDGLEPLGVIAARLRLALDLRLEAELARRLAVDGGPDRAAVAEILPACDVVLPTLLDRMTTAISYESLGERIEIPTDPADLPGFAARLDDARRRSLPGAQPHFHAAAPTESADAPAAASMSDRSEVIARHLADLAQRRWRLAAGTPILIEAPVLAQRTGPMRPLEHAVLGSLGAFPASERGQLNVVHPTAGPLDQVMRQACGRTATVDATKPREGLLEFFDRPPPERPTEQPDGPDQALRADPVLAETIRDYRGPDAELVGVLLYLTSPDPLDELVRRVVGLPEGLTP